MYGHFLHLFVPPIPTPPVPIVCELGLRSFIDAEPLGASSLLDAADLGAPSFIDAEPIGLGSYICQCDD